MFLSFSIASILILKPALLRGLSEKHIATPKVAGTGD
jgi:hypothetical protein